MSKDNNILELLKKLKRLSDSGVDGEKENATDKLEKLMKKHGITWDMIDENVPKRREFKVHKKDERFFFQTMSSVIGSKDYRTYNSDNKKIVKRYIFEMTDLEFIEFDSKYHFYLDKYKSDLEIFYLAFIQKNELYRKRTDDDKDDDDKPLSEKELEEIKKIRLMMFGMESHKVVKRIE